MKEITSKTLLQYLQSLDEDVHVKIFCSYNHYDLKRVVLYDNNLILEVGDTNNIEEDYNPSSVA